MILYILYPVIPTVERSETIEQTLYVAQMLAEKVIRMAGQVVRDSFDQLTCVVQKGSYGDVVTAVDYESERIIWEEITEAFPNHAIHSEERGHNGQSNDWLWLIDPLDGTNNFAIGLPVFSISITLMYRAEPVLGVIYEPLVDRLYVASKRKGAYCNGIKLAVNKREDLQKGTIGWIQGHQVQNGKKAVNLRQHLDVRFKRMMRLWAPTLQWCMLAKGDIDGIILYNSEGAIYIRGYLWLKKQGRSLWILKESFLRKAILSPISLHAIRITKPICSTS
ncbi:inositol monophosphatase family protein [Paenibacillus xylanexedens]|uniref:inositol monophosphatase family protein n=1 Tax=Paenibacillus xylanexedens TaxID=528191 RepID=UPI0028CB5F3D|nr:inositol monophosphatase family protein [Paenibacillus xylanexedens]